MRTLLGGVAVAAMVSCAVFLTSCELEEDRAPGEILSIEPPEKTLQGSVDTVVFNAVGGEAPFIWAVSDPLMGSVSGDGRTVTYTRTAREGANTVLVKDANQWTATAQVLQSLVDLSVFPTTASVSTNGGTQVFAASGGSGSYNWAITSGDGRLSASSGPSTVYSVGTSLTGTIVALNDGLTTISVTISKTP